MTVPNEFVIFKINFMETKTYTKRINQLERRVTTLEEILTTIRPTNIQQDIWERSAGIISKKKGGKFCYELLNGDVRNGIREIKN